MASPQRRGAFRAGECQPGKRGDNPFRQVAAEIVWTGGDDIDESVAAQSEYFADQIVNTGQLALVRDDPEWFARGKRDSAEVAAFAQPQHILQGAVRLGLHVDPRVPGKVRASHAMQDRSLPHQDGFPELGRRWRQPLGRACPAPAEDDVPLPGLKRIQVLRYIPQESVNPVGSRRAQPNPVVVGDQAAAEHDEVSGHSARHLPSIVTAGNYALRMHKSGCGPRPRARPVLSVAGRRALRWRNLPLPRAPRPT